MKRFLIIIAVLIAILLTGLVRIWPHSTVFGSAKINSFEYFGNCRMGDVRVCDYDPFGF